MVTRSDVAHTGDRPEVDLAMVGRGRAAGTAAFAVTVRADLRCPARGAAQFGCRRDAVRDVRNDYRGVGGRGDRVGSRKLVPARLAVASVGRYVGAAGRTRLVGRHDYH